LGDICNKPECCDLAKNASQIVLPCGHPNCGVGDEMLPCLFEGCDSFGAVDGQDYCNICFVEGLIQAPCIQLRCGHIFHFHCLKKRLELRWNTPRMLFDFCLCPLCKAWIEVDPRNQLFPMLAKYKETFEKIKDMCIKRLKLEDRMKDEKLVNPSSLYYNKPLDYAIKIYSYYECFKCKSPYFGGLKDCMRGLEDEKNDGWKPEELVCAKCSDQGGGINECKTHGKDFIEFKCRFCCSVSQWFCWGNTHFCEPCHKKQCNGTYLNKLSKDKLPQCPGKENCPLGVEHPPTGDEYSLGCAICRNLMSIQNQ
jgi:hypothetical protein